MARFGLSLPPFGEHADPRVTAQLARLAESAGWDGFFVWDHMLPEALPVADPWVTLAAVAAATERMTIGPLVTPIPRRRPVVVARQAVSLDLLSGGRVVLGVGIGDGPIEFDLLGEEGEPKTRGAMLDEALTVITSCWTGQPFKHHGRFYEVDGDPAGDVAQLRGAQFLPMPLQEPRIPIWVAGVWPRKPPLARALRWDAYAPVSSSVTVSPDEVRAMAAEIRERRGTLDGFDLVITVDTPGDDPDRAGALAADYIDAGATWLIERIDHWRFDAPGGAWPTEAIRDRVQAGPPVAGSRAG